MAGGQGAPTAKVPRVQLDTLTFNSGQKISLNAGDIVIVVGPNNVGKSVLMRDIEQKLVDRSNVTIMLREISIATFGTTEEFKVWALEHGRINATTSPGPQVFFGNTSVMIQHVSHVWENRRNGLAYLTNLFCDRLTTEARLAASNPVGLPAFSERPPSHPIHHLYLNEQLEREVSHVFHRAFDVDLIVDRLGGREAGLYVGKRPDLAPGESTTSFTYSQSVKALPALAQQGDGMRSFAGVILHVLTGDRDIVIVDEPEAFLHPPQARLLGHMLVKDARHDRQLIFATHNGDFLRGAINAGGSRLRVIRISREGPINPIHELDSAGIADLWRDPLLRQSNALDGLFHSLTIVCEADTDCRFYSAVADAVWTQRNEMVPDVMFTHCGGKDRIPMLLASLRALSVPVRAVTDFDVLRSEQPLRKIVEALGHGWEEFSTDWSTVKTSVDQKKPDLKSEEVKEEIGKILHDVTLAKFPEEAGERIRDVLRKSSPWSIAKLTGKAYVPSGDATRAFDRLVEGLHRIGLFVVENGELESFDRTIGRHGPEWVNRVLEKNLVADASLHEARKFVERLLS